VGAVAGLALPTRFILGKGVAQSARRVLVVIFQRGAVDGLNMVVPFREPEYYAQRPGIAVPPPGEPSGGLDLDDQFALHPALASLQPLFISGELAVVHACGSPDPTRSHFEAQDYMETAVPGDKSVIDGWLNRYLQVAVPQSESVFRGIAIASSTPRALAGRANALAVSDLAVLSLGTGQRGAQTRAALATMYGGRSDLPAIVVGETLRAVDFANRLNPDAYDPENGAVYPSSVLGLQLRQIAQTIKSGVGLEVAFAVVWGWETHLGQGASEGLLANALRDLGDGIAALRTDLGEAFADVCVLTMSEFGRTVRENGTGGTDHGHGTAMLIAGGTVRGGTVYGTWPGLNEERLFEGRDLAVTTDFRAICAEIVVRHLGFTALAEIFPDFVYDDSQRLGLIS